MSKKRKAVGELQVAEAKKQHVDEAPMREEKSDGLAHLTCPITQMLFCEPTTVSCCGSSFEKEALKDKRYCPTCDESLPEELAVNVSLQKAVAVHLEGNKELVVRLHLSKEIFIRIITNSVHPLNPSVNRLLKHQPFVSTHELWKWMAEGILEPFNSYMPFLANVLENNQQNFYIPLLFARRKISQRDYDGAIHDCEQALAISHRCAIAHGLKAIAHAKKGENDKAIKSSDTTLFYDPENEQAIEAKCFVLLNQGKYSEAINAARACEVLEQKEIIIGTGLYYSNEFSKSIESFTTAITNRKNFDLPELEPYCLRALAYARLCREDDALKDVDKALAISPHAELAYLAKGIVLVTRKLNSDAVIEFTQALALNPNNTASLACRAMAFLNLGKLKESSADCDAALKKNAKEKSLIYLVKALILFAKEKYPEALQELESAFKAKDKFISHSQAYSLRFHIYDQLKQYNESMIEDLYQCMYLDSKKKLDCYQNIIKVRLLLKQDPTVDCDKAINNDCPKAYYQLVAGKFHYENNNFDRAQHRLTQVIESKDANNEDKANAYAMRAACLQSQGHSQRAIDDSDAALKLNPHLELAVTTRAAAIRSVRSVCTKITDFTQSAASRLLTSSLFRPAVSEPVVAVVKHHARGGRRRR